MLKNTRDARDSNGYLDSRSVQNSLKRLSEQADAASMYHITEQNAGLIIRRLESSYSFQTFELSPTNKAAMTTKGRLIREFPATVTEVSAKDFNNSSFQEVLTKTLVTMSHQAVAEMQPKVKKAQQMHNEERDTTDPRIVTELLTSFLRGAGTPGEIKAIQKRTREEVSWNNSRDPWTRSPQWLLLRVGLQLTMTCHPQGSLDLYKRFMVFLIAQALKIACEKSSSSEMIHLMIAKISRRLCKLGDIEDGAWLHTIRDIISSASGNLKKRWINIQRRNEQPLDLNALAEFNYEEHTAFSLPELDTFLATIPRRPHLATTKEFKAKPMALALEPLTLPTINGSKGSTLDLIPSRTLQDLLPDIFADNHVHWLEEASGDVEFCHVTDPWPSKNMESWHLRKSTDTWKLSLGKESVLVSPWSELGQHISNIFSRLQPASDLHLVLHQESKELEIKLPKIHLEFTIRPPAASSYNLTAGCHIRDEDLRAAVAPYVVRFASSPDAISVRRFDEKGSEVGQRRREDYRKKSFKAVDNFVKHLKRQWPTDDPEEPEDPNMELASYIKMGPAVESAFGKWDQWLKNLRLKGHLDMVASYMRDAPAGEFIQVPPALPRTLIPTKRSVSRFVATSDLFSSSGVLHHKTPPALGRLLMNSERDRHSIKLSGIIDNLDSKAQLDYEHRYMRELKDTSKAPGPTPAPLGEMRISPNKASRLSNLFPLVFKHTLVHNV
ncbi:hypothetical protein RAB80_013089 [Fusarium oxysporum f. sp. vasinfectum]|nr:hypothetical protein RAB80_013089 [Fusarium oxysporum f. sp. vasinfectum]